MDVLQTCVGKGIAANAGNAFRDRDACKAAAILKSTVANGSEALGKRDIRQKTAAKESIVADGC